MVNIITGLIAIIGMIVFLAFYVWRIPSVVFWVITATVMALAITDVVKAVRSERRTNRARDEAAQSRGE